MSKDIRGKSESISKATGTTPCKRIEGGIYTTGKQRRNRNLTKILLISKKE